MRVAVVTDTFFPQVNGVTKTLNRMQAYMQKNDITHKFFIPEFQNDDEEAMERVISFKSINFFLYPELQIALPFNHVLTEELNAFEPEIIHVITQGPLGFMGLQYGLKHDIPVVASYTTDFPNYLKFYGLGLFEKPVWLYLEYFHNNALLNYVPSRYSFDQLEQHGIRNKMIWGRGIDVSRFTPQKRRSDLRRTIAPGGEKIMLYAGRLSKEKKVDVLIEATQMLKDEGQAVKLVLVGDGPHRQELQSLKVPEVYFAGYQSGEELQAYFASADLFVFASENETYGNVILEAMASGLPVVSVNSGGVRENLIDGTNGIAIETNKPAEFARKIQKLLSDEAAIEKLGRNAWQHAQNKDWENLFHLLYDSYLKIRLQYQESRTA